MPKKQTKIILGLVGEICAGKDTVADYLAKKYKSKTISFSQPLRDIMDRLYLAQTRDNLAKCGIALRGAYGQDILSRVIADEIKASKSKILTLPNVRLESDLTYLKREPGLILVNIDANEKTRFERIKKRGQNADDQSKTWQEFKQDSKLPTEIHIRELAKKCKYSLTNNNGFKELYQQIDSLMKKI